MSFMALSKKDLLGRDDILTDLYHRALDLEKGSAQNIFLSGPRGIGKSELLQQLFNHLFWQQGAVVPFYYSANNALLSASNFARDYVLRFLCQRLAFEKKEQALLSLDGVSIDVLSSLAARRAAPWVQGILDRYVQSAREPLDALRIALDAPLASVIATGKPVVIMIDEFQRLENLHHEGVADSQLVSLLDVSLSCQKTAHFVTGNNAEILEMPVAGSFGKRIVPPLGFEDSSSLVSTLLHASGTEDQGIPADLINHLGGNPFYLSCLARTLRTRKTPSQDDFWRIYLEEITGGQICLFWSSILKTFFPDFGRRKDALEVLHGIYNAEEPVARQATVQDMAINRSYPDEVVRAVHLAGLAHGEFGVVRATDDRVVRDVLNGFYLREILGRSLPDAEREILGRVSTEKEKVLSFEIGLPMIRESELIAARCLEQIGKNHRVNEEAIGQLQMAVIEACINAVEHGAGASEGGGQLSVIFRVYENRLEASVESPGREFIVQDTGEPFAGPRLTGDSKRGWGITLMKRLTDEVRFERTARGTKVVMVKYIAKTSGITKAKEAGTKSE